jgi:hypothetical protein
MPLVKPVNRILSGPPVETVEMIVGAAATALKMLPGRFVVYDAADNAVKEAGAKADDVMGILEVTGSMKITDNYAVGEPCRVIPLVPGTRVMCTLVTGGAAVVMGDKLVTAADGKAAKLAVGAMGGQGTVVAKVLLAEDPTSADKTCLVELVSGAEPAAAS